MRFALRTSTWPPPPARSRLLLSARLPLFASEPFPILGNTPERALLLRALPISYEVNMNAEFAEVLIVILFVLAAFIMIWRAAAKSRQPVAQPESADAVPETAEQSLERSSARGRKARS